MKLIEKLYWTGFLVSAVWIFIGLGFSTFLGSWFILYAFLPIATFVLSLAAIILGMLFYTVHRNVWRSD